MSEELKPPRMPNQAPAQEPVQAPAQEPIQEPIQTPAPVVDTAPVAQPTSEEGTSAVVVEPTGNAALDVAVSTFVSMTKCTEADIQRAMVHAIQYQDENLIDAAFIKERFGEHSEQAMALAKAVLQENIARTATEIAKAEQSVVAVAGSKDAWNEAVAVFNAHADADTKKVVKLLLDNGLHTQGAQQLMQFVQNSGRVAVRQGSPLSGSPSVPGNGLSRAEFQSELQKLKQEAGGRSLESGQFGNRYQELLQRRAQGRAAGK